jgi:hypothetical protein
MGKGGPFGSLGIFNLTNGRACPRRLGRHHGWLLLVKWVGVSMSSA